MFIYFLDLFLYIIVWYEIYNWAEMAHCELFIKATHLKYRTEYKIKQFFCPIFQLWDTH